MLLGVFQGNWGKLLLPHCWGCQAKQHLKWINVNFWIQQHFGLFQIRQSVYCIEPGGAPCLVLPFSTPAANWGPVEPDASYNKPTSAKLAATPQQGCSDVHLPGCKLQQTKLATSQQFTPQLNILNIFDCSMQLVCETAQNSPGAPWCNDSLHCIPFRSTIIQLVDKPQLRWCLLHPIRSSGKQVIKFGKVVRENWVAFEWTQHHCNM